MLAEQAAAFGVNLAKAIADTVKDLKALGYVLMAAGALSGNIPVILIGAGMVGVGTAADNGNISPWSLTPPPEHNAPNAVSWTDPKWQGIVDNLRKLPKGDLVSSAVVAESLSLLNANMTNADAIAAFVAAGWAKRAGGLAGYRGPEINVLGEGGGAEWVINAPALRALASLNRAPAQTIAAVSGIGGIGGVPPHSHDIVMDGARVALAVDQRFATMPRRK